jgi:hypothetical protein
VPATGPPAENALFPRFSVDPDQAQVIFRRRRCFRSEARPPPKSRARCKNRLLLTSQVFRRRSKRIDGGQIVAALLTLVVIVFVGFSVWTHG